MTNVHSQVSSRALRNLLLGEYSGPRTWMTHDFPDDAEIVAIWRDRDRVDLWHIIWESDSFEFSPRLRDPIYTRHTLAISDEVLKTAIIEQLIKDRPGADR
jgi:hypothetical protein